MGRSLSAGAYVAWEIERIEGPSWDRSIFHSVIPLTTEGSYESSGNIWCIKTPDGKFDFYDDQTCDNEAKALAVGREKDDAAREPKAKAKAT
jgi:hypothetical protein